LRQPFTRRSPFQQIWWNGKSRKKGFSPPRPIHAPCRHTGNQSRSTCFVVGSAFAAEVARPRRTADSTETEIGGKEWKLAEVTVPHCHLANRYQESTFESGIPRKTGASGSKLYRHVANSLAGSGKVTVEGSSKRRKIMSAAGQGAGPIRLAAPSFHQPAAPCCHFPQYSKSARRPYGPGLGNQPP